MPPGRTGTLVTNPPYDERMKTASIDGRLSPPGRRAQATLGRLHGLRLHRQSRGGQAHRPAASAKIRLFNGPIECRL